MRIEQKPNYKIVIKTDSYTGNFERELVSYIFGILDSVQMDIDYCPEYIQKFQEEENLTIEDSEKFLEEYLFETYQGVDDWEQMTFYSIGDYLTRDEKNPCTSIFVQLFRIPDNEWKERIIRRIKSFFDGGFEKMQDLSWQKSFGEDCPRKNKPQLLSLLLVDGEYSKNGVIENWQ